MADQPTRPSCQRRVKPAAANQEQFTPSGENPRGGALRSKPPGACNLDLRALLVWGGLLDVLSEEGAAHMVAGD